ncbi:hypothetical protein RRSWK_01866 [Rhodopirellula sp. SWK7]|nr:hypothetical protein RRSWK_01866 [Rhodopirellula sp. SWK7]
MPRFYKIAEVISEQVLSFYEREHHELQQRMGHTPRQIDLPSPPATVEIKQSARVCHRD